MEAMSARHKSFNEEGLSAKGRALQNATTRLDNAAIPGAGEIHYCRNFPAFQQSLDMCNTHIRTALQSCEATTSKRPAGHTINWEDDVSVEEWMTTMLDDVLLGVDVALDQHSAAAKAAAMRADAQGWYSQATVDADDTVTKMQGQNSPAVQPLALDPADVNAARPQDMFVPPVDNSNTPFRPRLDHLSGLTSAPLPTDLSEIEGFHPFRHELDTLRYLQSQLSVGEVQPPRPLEDTPLHWVDTLDTLTAMVADLSACQELALDLEAHSFRSFQGFTCLLQLSSRTDDYIVDGLALRPHLGKALAPLLSNPDVVKVLHGSDQDVVWLQRDYGLFLVNLFDTGQAARVLNLPSAGLAYLLDTLCNVKADKSFQMADWRLRPLSPEMLDYARGDTHYLLYCYDRLKHMLAELPDHQVPPLFTCGLPPGPLCASPEVTVSKAMACVLERSRQLCYTLYHKDVLTAASAANQAIKWGLLPHASSSTQSGAAPPSAGRESIEDVDDGKPDGTSSGAGGEAGIDGSAEDGGRVSSSGGASGSGRGASAGGGRGDGGGGRGAVGGRGNARREAEGQLSPVSMCVFASLYVWRDSVCRALDENVGYVLPRAQLIRLAQEMPGNVRRLKKVLGSKLSPVVQQRGEAVVAAIEQGKQAYLAGDLQLGFPAAVTSAAAVAAVGAGTLPGAEAVTAPAPAPNQVASVMNASSPAAVGTSASAEPRAAAGAGTPSRASDAPALVAAGPSAVGAAGETAAPLVMAPSFSTLAPLSHSVVAPLAKSGGGVFGGMMGRKRRQPDASSSVAAAGPAAGCVGSSMPVGVPPAAQHSSLAGEDAGSMARASKLRATLTLPFVSAPPPALLSADQTPPAATSLAVAAAEANASGAATTRADVRSLVNRLRQQTEDAAIVVEDEDDEVRSTTGIEGGGASGSLEFIPVPLSEAHRPRGDMRDGPRQWGGVKGNRGGRGEPNVGQPDPDADGSGPSGADSSSEDDSEDSVGLMEFRANKRGQQRSGRHNKRSKRDTSGGDVQMVPPPDAVAANWRAGRSAGSNGGREGGRGRGGRGQRGRGNSAALLPGAQGRGGGRGGGRDGGGSGPRNPYALGDDEHIKAGKRSTTMPRSGNRSFTFT